MGTAVGLYGLGLLLMLLGGDSLQRGLSGLAQKLGLAPAATGIWLLSLGFCLPQLAVALHAGALGLPTLGVAGAIGAGVANVSLLLGLSALVAPLMPGLPLLAGLRVLLLLAAGAVLVAARDGLLGVGEGGLLLAAFLAALAYGVVGFRRQEPDAQAEFARSAVTTQRLVQNLLRIGFAGVFIYFGSRLLVLNVSGVSRLVGLGDGSGALLLLGIGGALPGIGVTAMSAINGMGRVVMGELLMAALANLLLAVGLVAVLAPRPVVVPASAISWGLPAMMALAILLFPLTGARFAVDRRGAGWLLLAFAVWVAAVVAFA